MRKAIHLSRTPLACLATLAIWLSGIAEARADQAILDRIETMTNAAMKKFDELETKQAVKLLERAIDLAEKNNLESDPLLAKVHLSRGIIYYNDEPRDIENARRAFRRAVKIDGGVEISPGYSTPELRELLEEVRAKYGPTETPQRVDCSSISGLQHDIVDSATAGENVAIIAHVGSDVEPTRVSLHYRMHQVEGASPDYAEVEMQKGDQCSYTAAIPGNTIKKGGVLHYYVAAYSDSDRILASKGASGSPNIVDVVEQGSVVGENPLDPNGEDKPTPTTRALFVTLKLGSGGAFITGITEQLAAPVNCCFAPALFHFQPEVGYFITPQLAIAAAFRVGVPVGANRPNHATAAPSGVLRVRYALAESGEGLSFSGAVGGGVIRQTVRVEDADQMGDTDTTAIGPLLLGGGIGYASNLSDLLRLVAEVDVTAGLPVVSTLGTARLNFGIQFDVSLGIAFMF